MRHWDICFLKQVKGHYQNPESILLVPKKNHNETLLDQT